MDAILLTPELVGMEFLVKIRHCSPPVPQRKLSTRHKGRLRSLEIRGSSDTEDDVDEEAGHLFYSERPTQGTQ